jgi:hypothetical protein
VIARGDYQSVYLIVSRLCSVSPVEDGAIGSSDNIGDLGPLTQNNPVIAGTCDHHVELFGEIGS